MTHFTFLLIGILVLLQVLPVYASNHEPNVPSKPLMLVYAIFFFFMNTIQDALQVVVAIFIWKELYQIYKLLSGGKN
ncbi:MAG: hypothetical protein ACW99A_15510 [Candidatus Kariarchaeaceae archaeon]|jgi:hypothetical protein